MKLSLERYQIFKSKYEEHIAYVAYHYEQVSPHDICYQRLPENKQVETPSAFTKQTLLKLAK
jgi:hypothetical protein